MEQVTLESFTGPCQIEGRDMDRNRLRVEIREPKEGIYHCFEDGKESCRWEKK